MDDSNTFLDAPYPDHHDLTPEQLDEYERLINVKPPPSLADQFAWLCQIPVEAPSRSEPTLLPVSRKRKYSDMATQDELNSHATSRKRPHHKHPHPHRYAVPPRIRKGPPTVDTEALHVSRGLLWKKQGDRVAFHPRAPNRYALELRRVHHWTSALLDYAMSYRRTRHVKTSWYSIRGLYQCLMEHVNSVASQFPSPRMKAWTSYLTLFKNMMELNVDKENLKKFRVDISNQLFEALSREQAQNLPTPPSGSTSEALLEDVPPNGAHPPPQQHLAQHDRSRSTSQPTPPSDSRAANAHGHSPVTHTPPHSDAHVHPGNGQSRPPRPTGVIPELPRHGALTLDWRAAQDLMRVLQRTRVGYNTGERRDYVKDLNAAVLKAHFPRTYVRTFGPDGVGNTAEDMRSWGHIHGDDLPKRNGPIEPLGVSDELEVHDLDEEEAMGGDFPYPNTPDDVVWILVLGKSLLTEMDFLAMAEEEQARVDSSPHSLLCRPEPKVVKQEPISQTNSPLLPLRDTIRPLRASSSPGASSSSSSSSKSSGEMVMKNGSSSS